MLLDLLHLQLSHFQLIIAPLLADTGVSGKLQYIGAGIAAIAFVGSGVGQGIASSKAVEAVGRNPESESKVRTMFIIGAAITESGAIYGLVVAMILLFVVQ